MMNIIWSPVNEEIFLTACICKQFNLPDHSPDLKSNGFSAIVPFGWRKIMSLLSYQIIQFILCQVILLRVAMSHLFEIYFGIIFSLFLIFHLAQTRISFILARILKNSISLLILKSTFSFREFLVEQHWQYLISRFNCICFIIWPSHKVDSQKLGNHFHSQKRNYYRAQI